MDLNKISVRYAKALFLTSKDKNNLDEIYKDVVMIREIFTNASEINVLYNNPTIKTLDKIKITNSIFEGKINKLLLQTIMLVIENKREHYLPGIFRNFIDLYKTEKGVITVDLVTSSEINDDLKAKISEIVQKSKDTKIELQQSVNKDLIGGFILTVDGKQYDASVSSKLNSIKQNLLNATFETKLPKLDN